MTKHRFFTLVLALAIAVPCFSACSVPAQVLPQSFVAEVPLGATPAQWVECDTLRVTLGGRQYMAVAFGNGILGAFKVLDLGDDSPQEVYSLERLGMPGRHPHIELVDVNGDKQPEILAKFTAREGSIRSWLFSYDQGTFRSITPVGTDGDEEYGAFSEPTFLDVDGDGVLEAIDSEAVMPPTADQPDPGTDAEPRVPVHEESLFRLSEDGFSRAESLAYAGVFVRGRGEPVAVEHRFAVSGNSRDGTLQVVNGAGSEIRVTSATVRLNGAIVLGPNDFKRKEALVMVPVRVLTDNVLTVEVNGKPGSRMAILIR